MENTFPTLSNSQSLNCSSFYFSIYFDAGEDREASEGSYKWLTSTCLSVNKQKHSLHLVNSRWQKSHLRLMKCNHHVFPTLRKTRMDNSTEESHEALLCSLRTLLSASVFLLVKRKLLFLMVAVSKFVNIMVQF